MSESFRTSLLSYFDDLEDAVQKNGEWTVKGFIDIYRQIYTISLDTKVLSKVLELLMFPVLQRFALENNFRLELAKAQNHYPDITLIDKDDNYYAIDIKTTYRKHMGRNGLMRVSGMTLGTFGGYFRDRTLTTNITYPYSSYQAHYVLGVIYTQADEIDEGQIYTIDELEDIPSVARDFAFFLHEKYRIASDRPGSGNTKNIGSTKYEERLLSGNGPFARPGKAVFDDYWINYLTRSMAKSEGFAEQPYRNLKEYRTFKARGAEILDIPEDEIESEDDEIDDSEL